MRGWRLLGLFWAVLLTVLAGGVATLQALGPPGAPPGPGLPPLASAPGHAGGHDGPAAAPTPPIRPAASAPAASRPAPSQEVAAPDPALLERFAGEPGLFLPRIGPGGRAPRTAYAAPAPPVPEGRPRIALLVAGFGLSERDSRAALASLPGPVSFAASAYAGAPPALFEAARAGGHEILASVPMEPQGYPLNDAGPRSLLTGLTEAENRQNLDWALARTPGAVGATGASDGMRGERFAEIAEALGPALDEVARRGLLYVDPRPGRVPDRPGLAARAVDVVLDDTLARAEIEARLLALERTARERGSAVGLVLLIRPLMLERLAAWLGGIGQRGLALVPVSALVPPPTPPATAGTEEKK